jgi:flavin-binding protein dodecin
MSDHVFKKVEITGTSQNSMEEAVNNALQRAGQSLRNLRWFEVVELRGDIENNAVKHWQVTLKVGFALDS